MGTMRRWFFTGMWLLATIGAVTLARLAVGVVADQVDVQASPPLSDSAVRAALSEEVGDGTTTDTTDGTTPDTTPATTGSSPGSTPATSPGASPGTTPDDSTTTTGAAAPVTRTYDLVGGTVSVRFSGGDTVELLFATPADGFDVEIDDAGPAEVRVEFESDDHRSRLRARWSGGQPTEEIREDD